MTPRLPAEGRWRDSHACRLYVQRRSLDLSHWLSYNGLRNVQGLNQGDAEGKKMKLGIRITAVLCVLIGFWPVLRTLLTGSTAPVTSSSAKGAMIWFFGIGGIALLCRKVWGWWFCTIGSVLCAIGGVAAYRSQDPLSVPLVMAMAMIAIVLLLNTPSTWLELETPVLVTSDESLSSRSEELPAEPVSTATPQHTPESGQQATKDGPSGY